MRTFNFTLDSVAIDFRFDFLRGLSSLAEQHKWSSVNVKTLTNDQQNALFFCHSINKKSFVEIISQSISDVLENLKRFYSFDIQIVEKGYSIEIYNIKRLTNDNKYN